MPRWFRRFVAVIAVSLSAAGASAQKLTIQGDRFAVDGSPKFLTFISYFAAMGAPNIIQDFHLLHTLGFDGVRIWPNLDTGPQLMNGDGSLKPEQLARLRFILDQARLEHLVVDVSFTHEHIAGMTIATALTGIVNTTDALRSYDNLIFDIQNERNVTDRRYMSEEDCAAIYRAIKATDPNRIATADNSLGEDWGPAYAADFTARLGLDVTAFHEGRRSNWYTLDFYHGVVGTLRSNGKPAYLQEPNSTRDRTYAANDRAEYYLEAIANAKLAGAAAWCFHTLVAVNWNDGGPVFLEDRLREHLEPEWAFATSLRPRVQLKTNNGVNFVIAEGGGGSGVRADRTAAGPGGWDVWAISATSGGPVLTGDSVTLTAADGVHVLQASNGGGGPVQATSTSAGAWEQFTIDNGRGSYILSGETISLRVANTGWFVTAAGGGGGAVGATATAAGPFEQFRILYTTPHPTGSAP